MIKKKYFAIVISLCAVTLFLVFQPRRSQDLEIHLIQHERHISYGLTLKNNEAKALSTADLWVYAPVNGDLDFQVTTSHPASMERDIMGNRILHFVFSNLSPFATKIINIDVVLSLQSPPGKQILKDPDFFLEAEPLVQIKNPELIKLASQLHHEDSIETLNNIYGWVSSNLKESSYVARERGAVYALLKKQGDCTEFMQLSLALCRINKIPARGVSGYVIKQDIRLNPKDFHDWVEVYINGAWHVFDPFYRNFMDNEELYLAMRYHNPKQSDGFSRWKTGNSQLKVTMAD